jgi:hypothetical protein
MKEKKNAKGVNTLRGTDGDSLPKLALRYKLNGYWYRKERQDWA